MTYLLSFLARISLQSCQSSGALHTCNEIISLTSYYRSAHEEWLLKRYHRPRGSRLSWGSVQPLFSLQQRENVTFTFITSAFTSIWQETSAPGQQGASVSVRFSWAHGLYSWFHSWVVHLDLFIVCSDLCDRISFRSTLRGTFFPGAFVKVSHKNQVATDFFLYCDAHLSVMDY